MLKTDTIQITPELLQRIAGVNEFKGALRALGTLAPERLKALRRAATIESIGFSTRIEGSKLTDREVDHLLDDMKVRKTIWPGKWSAKKSCWPPCWNWLRPSSIRRANAAASPSAA